MLIFAQLAKAQIDYAPANLGLRLGPQDGHVHAVPGRNPNMPPWFEDLGVGNFGEILGNADPSTLQPDLAPGASAEDTHGSSSADPLSAGSLPADSSSADSSSAGSLPAGSPASEASERSVASGKAESGASFDVLGDGTVRLGRPTQHSSNSTASEEILPSEVQPKSDVPYPSEATTPDSESLTRDSNSTSGSILFPPSDSVFLEPPKPRKISLLKARSEGPAPPPLYILPDDNPEPKISTNINTFRPIVATSTYTTKVSGQIVTSTTVSTVDQKAFRFKSCIFGCPEMTSSDPLVGTTTIITVLPYQLPCSLVSCPPCPACFQSTVRVSVCPFISTVPGKAKVAVVNGPTITIVRSTVTRTRCTATRTISAQTSSCSCPTFVSTVTATVTAGKRAASGSLSSFSNDLSSGRSSVHALGDSHSEHPDVSGKGGLLEKKVGQEPDAEQRETVTYSTVTETLVSTVTHVPTKKLPSITITKTVVNHDDKVMVTVTTTVLPVTSVTETTAGVCSTFIICNPTQFTCPAQVTNLPQIKAVVQGIMEGQEKYGSGGVGSRRVSPNGAFLDDMGAPGVYGDGTDLVGGLAPVNAFGFGPDGMFAKVLGSDLMPQAEGKQETLLPPGAGADARAEKMTVSVIWTPPGSTRVAAAAETGSPARRSNIKKSQRSGAARGGPLAPLLLAVGLLAAFFL